MEQFLSTMFEVVRHERSLILLLLSLTGPDISRQNKFTDHEKENNKNLALEKKHRQRNLKEYGGNELF